MKTHYRTHTCGELNIKNVGEKVTLCGWVQRIRNLGGMKFIDLRDQYGITQIIISENDEIQKISETLVTECTVSVEGVVKERTNKNLKIPTGKIEHEAQKCTTFRSKLRKNRHLIS